MATRKTLADALGEDEPNQPQQAQQAQQPAPKKRGRKKANAAENEPAEEGQSTSGRAGSKARRNRTTPQRGTNTAQASDEPAKPQVLVPSTEDAKRAGLYLHNDDYRALGLAKLDDGCDYNARVRAMIALWRSNTRFRNQVDRLARTAPRGPYAGQKQR